MGLIKSFFTWVWDIVYHMVYLLIHPKELKQAIADGRTQAIYHLSSIYTWVGAFFTSLSYPAWAQDLAMYGKVVGVHSWDYMTTGPGGVAVKEAFKMGREAVANVLS